MTLFMDKKPPGPHGYPSALQKLLEIAGGDDPVAFELLSRECLRYSLVMAPQAPEPQLFEHFDQLVRLWFNICGKAQVAKLQLLIEEILRQHWTYAVQGRQSRIIRFFLEHEYARELARSRSLRSHLCDAAAAFGLMGAYIDSAFSTPSFNNQSVFDFAGN